MPPPLLLYPEDRDNHPALALLRQRTALHEPLFRDEPLQWHLKTGAYDRTPCCQSATYHSEFDLKVLAYLAPTRMVKRKCAKCGLEFMFAAKNLSAWLRLQLEERARRAAASAN